MALIVDTLKHVNAHPERLKLAWKWVQENGLDCQLVTYLKDIGNATLYEMKLLTEERLGDIDMSRPDSKVVPGILVMSTGECDFEWVYPYTISYKDHTGSLCREKHYFIRSEIADWRYNYFLAYKKIADEGELFDLRDAFESAACLSAHSIVENLAYGTTPEMYADMTTM